MEFRKRQLGDDSWRLFGQMDTGTIVYGFANIFTHASPEVIDTIGNALATCQGGSYDPDNQDPFD